MQLFAAGLGPQVFSSITLHPPSPHHPLSGPSDPLPAATVGFRVCSWSGPSLCFPTHSWYLYWRPTVCQAPCFSGKHALVSCISHFVNIHVIQKKCLLNGPREIDNQNLEISSIFQNESWVLCFISFSQMLKVLCIFIIKCQICYIENFASAFLLLRSLKIILHSPFLKKKSSIFI